MGKFDHIEPQHHEKIIAYALLLGVELEQHPNGNAYRAHYAERAGYRNHTMLHPHRIHAVGFALTYMGWYITSDGELTRGEL